MKNKNIGAKVLVKKVLLRINPQEGWVYERNVQGEVVELGNLKRYYHTCSGGRLQINKQIIEKEPRAIYAIQMQNIKDIENNNVVVFEEGNLRFLETIRQVEKLTSQKTYESALKIVEKYRKQNG